MPDLFRNIKKQQQQQDKEASATDKNSTVAAADKKRPLQLHGGFITAAQLEECKKIKLDTSENVLHKSEVITNEDGKQPEVIETTTTTNKMEDNKSKLKMLFGDESDADEAIAKGENGDNKKESGLKRKHEESEDKKRDHKHSKRKSEKRISSNNKTEEVSDKKQCTNETKASENGASSSVKTQETSNNKKRPKLKKTEIGTLVVKLLTPAYAKKRFDSRDTFKSTARSISHALLDKGKWLG